MDAPRLTQLTRLAPMMMAAGLSACAVSPLLTPRADLPLRQPTASALARQLHVQGQRGRLNAAQREALLQRVGSQGSHALLQRHLAVMSASGEVNLHAGNDVQLLVDGPATFAAMFKAIEQARQTVLLESYIVEHAGIAQELATLLMRKREQGVRVAMIYDALGSFGTDS